MIAPLSAELTSTQCDSFFGKEYKTGRMVSGQIHFPFSLDKSGCRRFSAHGKLKIERVLLKLVIMNAIWHVSSDKQIHTGKLPTCCLLKPNGHR